MHQLVLNCHLWEEKKKKQKSTTAHSYSSIPSMILEVKF